MASPKDPGLGSGMADALELRPVSVDELSTLRYIHASAFKSMANASYPDEEIAAFCSYIYTSAYADLVLGENLFAGYLGGEMVATGGWTPADDNGVSARIRSIYVRPLFTGIGIGRRMTLEAEKQARRSGFRSFGARVTVNAIGFFEALGYEITSYGVHVLPGERGLPVCFMRKSDRNAAPAVDTEE